MRTPLLPDAFPVGTLFALVDGVPVTESPDGDLLGWDCDTPRQMARSAQLTWTALSEPTFRSLVAGNAGPR
jgi:hypothetical protein